MLKPKKKKKRLSSPIKQLSKDALDNSNKSENVFLHDESEDTQPQVFTLDDITEDDIILTKLCVIILQDQE